MALLYSFKNSAVLKHSTDQKGILISPVFSLDMILLAANGEVGVKSFKHIGSVIVENVMGLCQARCVGSVLSAEWSGRMGCPPRQLDTTVETLVA